MRVVRISKEKRFKGYGNRYPVFLDGKQIGVLKNNNSICFTIDDNERHEIRAVNTYTKDLEHQGVIYIEPTEADYDPEEMEYLNLIVCLKGLSKVRIKGNDEYTRELAKRSQDLSKLECENARFFDKSINPGPTICGIIISVIILLFGYLFYSIVGTPIYLFIISILMSIVFCAAMIFDGRYIIIIPLPYIFLWKTYNSKPQQLHKAKTICMTLMILSPTLSLGLNILYSVIYGL